MTADSDTGSDLQRMLASIHWTFRTHVAPHVQGSLAQSYARTLDLLLDQAVKRTGLQRQALQEDLADLVETLAVLGISAPSVSTDGDNAELEAAIDRLEPLLSAAVPDLSGNALARADAFASLGLSRRDVLWAVRAF